MSMRFVRSQSVFLIILETLTIFILRSVYNTGVSVPLVITTIDVTYKLL
jgi:hypothetical protein